MDQELPPTQPIVPVLQPGQELCRVLLVFAYTDDNVVMEVRRKLKEIQSCIPNATLHFNTMTTPAVPLPQR
jgi:hypothetical protein